MKSLRAPEGARYVICRYLDPAPGTRLPEGKRIGMIVGARLRLRLGGQRLVGWHSREHALTDFEILREATPREVAVGMALH